MSTQPPQLGPPGFYSLLQNYIILSLCDGVHIITSLVAQYTFLKQAILPSKGEIWQIWDIDMDLVYFKTCQVFTFKLYLKTFHYNIILHNLSMLLT